MTRVIKYFKGIDPIELGIPALLFLLTLNLFLWRIELPATTYFDEARYVSAARQFLMNGINENWSHPGFGKYLIATGIALFGDRALGWRIMGVFFGGVSILSVYWLGLALFKNRFDALLGALIVVVNQLVFVQARIATLDILAVGLFMPAIALFAQLWMDSAALNRPIPRKDLILPSLLFGLAVAAKWIAIIPLFMTAILYVLERPERRWTRLRDCLLILFATACLVYLVTLIPFLGMKTPAHSIDALGLDSSHYYGWRDILKMQLQMFVTQFKYDNPQPYVSPWYSWPLTLRPIWYLFSRDESPINPTFSGIVLLGNPFIFWTSIPAVGYCVWHACRRYEAAAQFLMMFYFPLFMFWILVPRHTTFLYYYLPASILLGPMLIYAARGLGLAPWKKILYVGVAAGFFIYFFPLLSGIPLSRPSFMARIWFARWWF
ncbi:MAG: phospholipid carrier-dependent glycosyltransferase [Oligoflexia bacterium]|nr:phospholipid carrier-dependent glycosyltransferase [Oligoflexia bacterium]